MTPDDLAAIMARHAFLRTRAESLPTLEALLTDDVAALLADRQRMREQLALIADDHHPGSDPTPDCQTCAGRDPYAACVTYQRAWCALLSGPPTAGPEDIRS